MTEKAVPKVRKVMPQIRAMSVGDTLSFPIEWMDTVRSQTSKTNALLGGKRSTRLEVDERLIYVERTE